MAGWGLMEARTIVGVQVAFNLNPAATTRTKLNYQPAYKGECSRSVQISLLRWVHLTCDIKGKGPPCAWGRRISLSDTKPQEFTFNPLRCHN